MEKLSFCNDTRKRVVHTGVSSLRGLLPCLLNSWEWRQCCRRRARLRADSSLFVALAEVVSWTVQSIPCLADVARREQVVKRMEKKEEKEEEGLPGPLQDEESTETTWGA